MQKLTSAEEHKTPHSLYQKMQLAKINILARLQEFKIDKKSYIRIASFWCSMIEEGGRLIKPLGLTILSVTMLIVYAQIASGGGLPLLTNTIALCFIIYPIGWGMEFVGGTAKIIVESLGGCHA